MPLVSGTIDACWAAIEGWTPLKDSFEKKFKSDKDLEYLNLGGLGPVDIGEKAAIAIQLQPFEIAPRETNALNFPMVLKIQVWAPGDRYRKTIDLMEEIVKALFRSSSRASGKPTYLEDFTCGPPQKVNGFSVTFENMPQGTAEQASTFPVCAGIAFPVFLSKVSA